MIYNILGKNIKINTEDDEIRDSLLKELHLYSKGDINNIDVAINFVKQIKLNFIYSNTPSIHTTFQNGFMANFGNYKILYCIQNNVLKIDIEFHHKKSFMRKFRSITYKNNLENLSQIVHELILVPLNFFDKNRAIIHASTMKSPSGKTIMIGGTGGVGKTSLELMLCGELDYSFISDDIAVVDNNSHVYPNLSFPKIYAYNVAGNKKLKNLLFKNKSIMDKFQWEFMKKMKGDSGVRRSLSPKILFKNVARESNIINQYYILFKTNEVDSIRIENIEYDKASKLTMDIIKNEYHSIFQHITWHEYNSTLMKFTPILTLDHMFNNWMNTYSNLFKKIDCKIIKIPLDISHADFLIQMKNKLKS